MSETELERGVSERGTVKLEVLPAALDLVDTIQSQVHGKNRVRPGGPSAPLTPPDRRTVKHISADGNCLFRSLAYIITGAMDQHMAVRTAILQHMLGIAHFILGHHVVHYSSIQEYIACNNMDRESVWGTDIEILTCAHYYRLPLSHTVFNTTPGRYTPPGMWTAVCQRTSMQAKVISPWMAA